jgi:hypothetical protein
VQDHRKRAEHRKHIEGEHQMDTTGTTPDSRPLRYSEMSARRARRLSISPGIEGAPLIAPA